MPPLAVVGPVVLPLLAAVLIAICGSAGANLGRIATAVGAWSSLASLLAVWIPIHSTLELTLGPLGYGSSFDLRIDGVSFAFGLMITTPTALLLSLQPRVWTQSVLSLLALAAAMAAIEAGGVVLTAIAGGTAATLAVVLLDTEDPRAPRPSWAMLLAGWLALSWFGTFLQVGGGTAVYSAVPLAAVTGPLFLLLGASALLVSCVFPWRTWPASLWSRPSLRAAGITIATLYPLGFYLLVRAYELGDGRYPHPLFNLVLGLIGIASAFAAAVRAQAAATRRGFLGELIPGLGGLALAAIVLGTPLGLVAGLTLLATASALVACLAMLPDQAGLASLVTIVAAIGLPPGIAFGARVLGIEATFEAGDFLGLIGIAAAATWATLMVGGARAIGLPAGRGHPLAESFPMVSLLIALAILSAGPALAVLQSAFAYPVAEQVMQATPGALAGGLTDVVTVSSTLPVVTLFTPLLILGAVVYAITRTTVVRSQPRPPVFSLPVVDWLSGARAAIRAATVPEQYRTVFGFRELEAAASGGLPVLWLGALVALAVAVSR